MSDNKALVIITSIIFAATTLFFLAVLLSPLFMKTNTKSSSATQGITSVFPKIAANQTVTKGVLGSSILHINRDVQVDGTAWINGNLYLDKGSTLHIGDKDINTLLSNSQKDTPVTLPQSISQITQEIHQTGVLSLQSQTGDVSLSPGDGISISGLVIKNIDPGSSQHIFKTITAGNLSLSALTNDDVLTFTGSNGIAVTAGTGNTITIANTDSSLFINTGAGLSGGGKVSLGNAITLSNSGVLSLTGTPNQIATTGVSGDITLSLPQNINATASPIFAGLSLSAVATTSSNLTFRNQTSQVNILNGGTLGFYTSAGGDGGIAANPSLFIAGNGKLGIGTNNPGTNALQVNGGSLYVNGSSNSIIADGIVRSNTLFWMSNGNSGVSSILRLENFNAAATGLSLSAKLAGSDGTETEWPYQTISKDTTWTGTTSTRNSAIAFNTLFNNTSKEVLRLASTGFVSIGTASPLATLDIRSQSGTAAIASLSGKTSFAGLVIDNSGSGPLFTASNAGQTKFAIDIQGNTRVTASFCVKANITANCAGSTAGTIYATNQSIQNADYAENYVSSQQLLPGDIIMPAKDGNNNAILKTTTVYQSETIGVVSTNPGITLNSNAQRDEKHPYVFPIALSGRVPVTVSAQNGAIHTGDFITASSLPGVGMKAAHEGVIIGKALEDFSGSEKTGKILVAITVGWANPNLIIDSEGMLQASAENASTPTSMPFPLSIHTPLQTQIASMSSQIQQVMDMSDRVALLEKELAIHPTSSQSALLDTETATVSGTLSVLGRTLLSDVGITGKITAGLLTVNGLDITNGNPAATINTTGSSLRLQSLELGGIDMLNGKITIDTAGNMHVNASLSAKKYIVDTSTTQTASAGKIIIPKGKTSIDITTNALTENSLIFATPDTTPVAVAKKQISPNTFSLTIAEPLSEDLRVDWWIVN